MKKPVIEHREHDALHLDEGFVPLATLAVDGRSMVVQIQENLIGQLTKQKIEHACELLRDAFYRVRPDLRSQ